MLTQHYFSISVGKPQEYVSLVIIVFMSGRIKMVTYLTGDKVEKDEVI